MDFFLAINIIATVLLFFAVILLYVRQTKIMDLEKKYEVLNRELENSMAAFLMEIRYENEKFLKTFHQLAEDRPLSPSGSPKREERDVVDGLDDFSKDVPDFAAEKKSSGSNKEENSSSGSKAYLDPQELLSGGEGSPDVSPAMKNHFDITQVIKERMEEGISLDEIAKELNKGKTEMELLVKFNPELNSIYQKNSV
mgnify:CR=1 FL=1